mmetsp:Transcript_126056/g.177857  ORF Transcript_126056/g.177857 Transcript_126056/m.177857 type:complete len:84 (-) Transcript_126056:147-398(-)
MTRTAPLLLPGNFPGEATMHGVDGSRKGLQTPCCPPCPRTGKLAEPGALRFGAMQGVRMDKEPGSQGGCGLRGHSGRRDDLRC